MRYKNKGDVTMSTQINWLVHLEHHQNLLRQARQARLARLAAANHPVHRVEKKASIQQNVQSKPIEVICCQPATA
jgi:hypothetical protein